MQILLGKGLINGNQKAKTSETPESSHQKAYNAILADLI